MYLGEAALSAQVIIISFVHVVPDVLCVLDEDTHQTKERHTKMKTSERPKEKVKMEEHFSTIFTNMRVCIPFLLAWFIAISKANNSSSMRKPGGRHSCASNPISVPSPAWIEALRERRNPCSYCLSRSISRCEIQLPISSAICLQFLFIFFMYVLTFVLIVDFVL